jgi:signal transduction histidine kinase/DNA-binding response OmpR family regulator
MSDTLTLSRLTVRLGNERHVVQARQRARDIAALLGYEHQEQIRLATAASELARNAFRYAEGGFVEFSVEDSVKDSDKDSVTDAGPQFFIVRVGDTGPGISNVSEILAGRYVSKTGLGMGLIGTKRLMEHFSITSTSSGTLVEFGKPLPAAAARVTASSARSLMTQLASSGSMDPFDEIELQNQELLKTLAELKAKQEQLADLNRELEDTNRGVVALYAELEQHADDLRRVSDLKTSFLSNLSHEFRTPLNSIASLSRLLLGRFDGDLSVEQERQVTYIQSSAAELSEMVNDLLDLAKVEAGKIDVKPRHFEVRDFFGALRGMLKPLLAGNSLDLIFEAAPDLPTLYMDEGKISQVLRNLISNALKFTKKGYIRVSADLESGGWIIFRVADTGIGIAPEDQQRIFEEFVQIEGEMQGRVKGTGLGLPLSRKLTDVLGGTLSVESAPGEGSTFIVRVPVSVGGPAQEQVRSASQMELADAAILFVEDNRETSFVHQAAMKSSGHRAVFVANISEAREAMKFMKPELIVLDRLIDEKDCLYYIEELKSHGYGGPVLVVSVVDDERSALEAGATRFVAKPVAPFALLNVVRELIKGQPSKTILLVDDDEVTRYLVGGELAKLGYRVLEAHGGREAMSLISRETPDAIILDIVMPDMNGFEVLRQIRNRPSLQSLPVIIYSSREFSSDERKALSDAAALIYPKQTPRGGASPNGLLEMLQTAGVRA